MFRQGGDGGEGLAALVTLDLHAAVRVHALVSAQVRELGVGLEADIVLSL